MNDGGTPKSEEMDFIAASKEARRVVGKDDGERENRSAGTRSRGPSGRAQGLYGLKSKPAVREEDLASLLKKDAAPAESELLRALTVDAEPEEQTVSALDMASYLVSSDESESDSAAELTEAILNRTLDEEDPSEQALFDQLDAQLEEPAFEEAPLPEAEPEVPESFESAFLETPAEPAEVDDDDADYADYDDEEPPRRKRRGGLIAAVIAALLCVGVLGSAFAVSRRSTIFPRVAIHGENVSAMTVDEAAEVVRKSGWDGPDAVVLKAELPASVDLEVKAEDGRILFLHQLGAGLHSFLDHGHRAAAQGREDAGCAVLGMSFHSSLEGFGCAFLEVSSAAAMHMHVDEAGHYAHAFRIDEVCADDGQVAVRYFQYLVVAQDDATVLEPSLRGEDFAVDDLC